MRNKRIFIAVAVVASILVLVSLLLRSTSLPELPHKTVETTASQLHIGTDQAIATDDQGRVYFSNGRYLVQYDTLSGQSKRLSQDGVLPTISQIIVSPTSQYIAFQSVSTSFDDVLNAQVELTGYSSSDPQWWLLNATTGEYILLSTGAKDVEWDNRDNLHLLFANEILVFNARGERQKTIAVKNISTFTINGANYVAQTSDGKVVVLGADGKEIDELGFTYENVYLSPQTKQYLSYKLNDDEFDATLHLDTDYKLTDFKELAFAWNGAGDRLGYADDDGVHLVDTKSKTVLDYKITNSKMDNVREVIVLGANELLLRTENDTIYATGEAAATKATENTLFRIGDFELQGFIEGNRFIVTKEGAFSPQDRASIYAELSKLGYNPDLLRVYFEEVTLSEHPL